MDRLTHDDLRAVIENATRDRDDDMCRPITNPNPVRLHRISNTAPREEFL
jgi:hypothetical protein